jgi:nucleoside-diphosphate-sugar epimerase
MTRRVLVTGGTGFIGRQTVAPLVERGFEVWMTSRGGVPEDLIEYARRHPGRIHHRMADLLQPEVPAALIDEIHPSHVLHLAWDTRHGLFWTSPENEAWVAASERLLRAFADGGGQRLVAAGTCVEYAATSLPVSEATGVLEPATPYGRAKLAFRERLREAADRRGLSTAWGRVFHLFGPYEKLPRLVPAAIDTLLRGDCFRATTGTQVRDYSSVVDVAAAFVAILDSDAEGDLNVASGEPSTVAGVLGCIGEIVGRPDLIHLGVIPSPPHDPPVLAAETTRLRSRFGGLFAVPLETRLREMVDWWRQHGMRS